MIGEQLCHIESIHYAYVATSNETATRLKKADTQA